MRRCRALRRRDLLWLWALLALAGALSAARASPREDRQAALDLLGRGSAAYDVGDVISATRHWTEAIRLCQLADAPRLEAEALAKRGEAYRVEGQFREAAEDLTAALGRARAAGDEPLMAAASGALGNLAFMSRRTAAAEPLLLDSQARARRLGDAAVAGASANDLGNLYATTGRPQQAAQAYGEAVQYAEASGDPALAATAEVNAGRLALDGGDPSRGALLLRRATDRLMQLQPSYQVALALVAAGTAALGGAPEDEQPLPTQLAAESERAFEAVRAIVGKLGNTTLDALALGGLGHLRERAGRLEQAADLTQRASFQAQQVSAADVLFRLEWQQARIERALGHDAAALASFRRAVATLRSVRQDVPADDRGGAAPLRDAPDALYLQFADLLLRLASRDPRGAPALIREARDTLEERKRSELQDYFRDACIANLEARRRGIDTVAPDTAIVYPVIFPDRLALLVSAGETYRQVVVPVTGQSLRAEVERFRVLLERRSTNEFLAPAQRLYDLIIRPIEAMLSGRRIATLVIVPDGVLRTVPLAALHDGGHFLVERYALATVPGLQLVDPQPLEAGTPRTLTAGLSQSRQGFPALPEVVEEVEDVHRLEGGTVLLNSAFVRQSFERDLRDVDYSVVHIASHGQFGSDPSQTFVLTYDGRLDLDDLENSIKLARFREPGLELLVLDACQTAAGNDRAALGLAGLALKAGARSAVATLWSVSDQAAGPLMVDFYARLRGGAVSKARALQGAQRSMLADPLLSHPAYWAPFLLIGNWL